MTSKFARRKHQVAVLAVATLVAVASAACSSSGTGKGTAAADAKADPNGVLTYAFDLTGSSNNTFDLAGQDSPSTVMMTQLVFDTLLHAQTDGTVTPGLAEKATIVDPQTIDVTLHPNMKFTDGTPVNSDAARFTLLRLRDSASGKKNAPDFSALLGDVQVISPTQFRIKLTSPAAARFYDFLGHQEGTIVSPTAVNAGKNLNKEPVGAGPFILVEGVANQRYRFKKNPDYWDANNVKLGGINIIHVADQASRIAALRSGQVDMAEVTTSDVASLQSQYGIASVSTGDSLVWGLTCKQNPPLADARVRQALIYATNRDDLNKGALSGLGAPMNSLFPEGHLLADPDVAKQYAYDTTKAKDLLKQAGWVSGTEITTFVRAGDTVGTKTAEILQQQWAAVGISLKVIPSTDIVADFFSGKRQPMLFYGTSSTPSTKVSRIFTSDSIGNVCSYKDPELERLGAAIAAEGQTSPAAVKLWQDLQARLWSIGFFVPGVFQPITFAYDKSKLANANLFVIGFGYPDWTRTYVKLK